MTRARVFVLGVAMASTYSAGCQDDLTEVLMIVDSDLSLSRADAVGFSAQPGFGSPPPNGNCGFPSPIGGFPVSMAFVSEGSTTMFSVRVVFVKGVNVFPQEVVMSRVFSGIRFSPGELRMLRVSMTAVCACDGTSCPNPGTNPACDDVMSPATVPFDPLVAPVSTYPSPCPGNFGFVGGGPVR
jgi:hypothetical protein